MTDKPVKTFRHSASFGKRIEYWIIGRIRKEGLDVYVPLVDDHTVDDGSAAATAAGGGAVRSWPW